jgi:hypothetical protein
VRSAPLLAAARGGGFDEVSRNCVQFLSAIAMPEPSARTNVITRSMSASAGAREDRRVGGSRWADANYIQSDAESIWILLLVCHRVIWDPGYLVERIAICAHCGSSAI